MKWIYIEVDTNDADLIGKLSPISDEDLEIIRPLIEAISNFESYNTKDSDGNYTWHHCNNYPNSEFSRYDLGEKPKEELYPNISKEAFDIFEEYAPHGEYGFHTVEEIKIFNEPIETLL